MTCERWFRWPTMIVLLSVGLAPARSGAQAAGAWQQYATPANAGFSAAKLEAARLYADSVRSAAVMAIYRGRVLVAWGDVSRKIPAHSVRKSFVSALYGNQVATGVVRLDATLGEIGIDDVNALTAAEKQARVRNLLAARSGVFLSAAYAAADQDAARPARGSHSPGTYWFYNNWDFNVAGVIYEKLTGTSLYEAFGREIAQPIGMEDYSPTDGFLVFEPSNSRHPAATFLVSTRDVARFGQLFLQNGRWDDRQMIPAAWVRESTQAHSDLGDGAGYGYMWWTFARGSAGDRYPELNKHAFYQARGTGGQALFIIPDAELVIVHRGDTENGRNVAGPNIWRIAELILAAREGEPAARPELMVLSTTPFRSQAPPAITPRFETLSADARDRLVGSYEVAPGTVMRVFTVEGRLFMNVPGRGEAELFALSTTEFTIRVQPGVSVVFEPDANGVVTHVLVRLGEERMRARKLWTG